MDKINRINKDNAEFLKKQMEDKGAKERRKMNK
jgi:ribosomal protein L7/L12